MIAVPKPDPAGLVVRRARTSDVPAIKALVDIYAGKILLEKNLVTLYEAVQEFWVAENPGDPGNPGKLVGCGALHVLWSDLGEIRTVAVDPAAAAPNDDLAWALTNAATCGPSCTRASRSGIGALPLKTVSQLAVIAATAAWPLVGSAAAVALAVGVAVP